MTYKLGAHLSTAGGYYRAIEKIIQIGGNCLQIFSSSPMMWINARITDDDIQKFVKQKQSLHLDPIYFHACYLINCADSNEIGKKSIKSLIFELNLASKLEVKGSIVHTGSFKDGKALLENYTAMKGSLAYQSLISTIKTVLMETPQNTLLILENAGNRKIGRTIRELAHILEDVDDERVRICLDICHLHAAGYDLKSIESLEKFLNDFDTKIGLKNLEVIHMNDSKDPFGSLRDRHENIGKGQVGIEVFQNLLNNERTKHVPFIIETPGFDDKGPDKANLDMLKSLITS